MGLEFGKGFIDSLVSSRSSAFAHLEDFADRLSHFFSTVIILMLAGVTMANVYFLRPISCTLPTAPDFKFNDFAESVCWVRGTMALTESDQMPMNMEDWKQVKDKSDISFYQWVPFCLSIQAMLFFLPHVVWESLASYTLGENLDAILTMARNANMAEDSAKRQKSVEGAAYQLFRLSRQHQDNRSSRWARMQRRAAQLPCGTVCVPGKRMGNVVMVTYLFVKLLYLFNAIGQLYIIRTFLGQDGSLFAFGEKLLGTLASKREWSESEFFPRQTYCPVTVRHLGTNNNVYTAICALPVNMFNEKIYIFLWLWIAMVATITGMSMVIWIGRSFLQSCQADFIRDFLVVSLQGQMNEPGRDHPSECSACAVTSDDPGISRFIGEAVRSDGTFLLRMVRSNAGDVVAGEILTCWWHMFIEFERAECAAFEKRRTVYKAQAPLEEQTYGNLNQPDLQTLLNGTPNGKPLTFV